MKALKPLGKGRKVRSEKELLAELREVPTPPRELTFEEKVDIELGIVSISRQ